MVERRKFAMNSGSLVHHQTYEQRADLATYSTALDADTPIVMSVRGCGNNMLSGLPAHADPTSYRFEFGVELDSLDKVVLNPTVSEAIPLEDVNAITLANPDRPSYSGYGEVVKLVEDGGLTKPARAIVGNPAWTAGGAGDNSQGKVYVFNYAGNLIQEIVNPELDIDSDIEATFGYAIDVTADGTGLLIGAPNMTVGVTQNSGAAYLYEWSETELKYEYKIAFEPTAESSQFAGYAVAISQIQDSLYTGYIGTARYVCFVGTPNYNGAGSNRGGVYAYTTYGTDSYGVTGVDTAVLIEAPTPVNSDLFGSAVASNDTVDKSATTGAFHLAVGSPGRNGNDGAFMAYNCAVAATAIATTYTIVATHGEQPGSNAEDGKLGTSIAITEFITEAASKGTSIVVGEPFGDGAAGVDNNTRGSVRYYQALFIATPASTIACTVDGAGDNYFFGSSVAVQPDGTHFFASNPGIAVTSTFSGSSRGHIRTYVPAGTPGVIFEEQESASLTFGRAKGGIACTNSALIAGNSKEGLLRDIPCAVYLYGMSSVDYTTSTIVYSGGDETTYPSTYTTSAGASAKMRLERRLPQNLKHILGASADTVAGEEPTNTMQVAYGNNQFSMYYPPVVTANPTRINPFKRIEITYTGTDLAKVKIVKDDPYKLKVHINNIERKRIPKRNMETTQWVSKFKSWDYTGSDDIDQNYDPVEDLSSEGNPDRIAAGEWFQSMAVGDESIMSVYLCDIEEAFDVKELMYLPDLTITFYLASDWRNRFVTVIPPVITAATSTDSFITVNYPNYLLPSNFPMKASIKLKEPYVKGFFENTSSSDIVSFRDAYFNINSLCAKYELYVSSELPRIRPFVRPWIKYTPSYWRFPSNYTGQEFTILEQISGNPQGALIFVENPVNKTTKGQFITRRWNQLSTDIQITSIRLQVDSVQFPERVTVKDYNTSVLNGSKRDYLDMIRKTLGYTYDDNDYFDPLFETQMPLYYIPFENIVMDRGDYNENILGAGGKPCIYSYTLKFDTTSGAAWSSDTHEASLKSSDCKIVILYIQAQSTKMMGNAVTSTSAD